MVSRESEERLVTKLRNGGSVLTVLGVQQSRGQQGRTAGASWQGRTRVGAVGAGG